MTSPSGSASVPLSTMAVLMLSVFTVSMGYGVVLPLLPYLIERLLGTGGDSEQVSRATGLLTGLYTLSIFLFAPAWGRMSDRYGRRTVLLIGLIGFSATMLIFAFVENLTAVYAERFLSGMFAAAVTPGAFVTIGGSRGDRRGASAPPHLRQSGGDHVGFCSDLCWTSSLRGALPTCSPRSADTDRWRSR